MKKLLLIPVIVFLHTINICAQNNKIVDWIKSNKCDIQTCDPSSDNFDDLKFIGDIVEDKQIIGLGEATHGTREFRLLQQRIFKYMIKEYGATVLIVEEPYYQDCEVNKYILTGEGNLNEISKHGYWGFNIKERIDFINWMKEYNEKEKNPSKKLKIFGMDSYQAHLGKLDILNYLKKVDAESFNKYSSSIELLSNNELHIDEIKKIQSLFEKKRSEYIQKSSLHEYLHVSHLITNIIQYSEWQNDEDYREIQMANNVEWYIKNFAPTSKVMIYCHDAHISCENSDELKSTGAYLKDKFGEKFISIGTVFNHGSFIVPQNDKLVVFTYSEAPKGYISEILAQVNSSIYFIDLRKEMLSDVEAVLKGDINMQGAGGYYPRSEREHINIDVGNLYDGLIFIETSNPYTLLDN